MADTFDTSQCCIATTAVKSRADTSKSCVSENKQSIISYTNAALNTERNIWGLRAMCISYISQSFQVKSYLNLACHMPWHRRSGIKDLPSSVASIVSTICSQDRSKKTTLPTKSPIRGRTCRRTQVYITNILISHLLEAPQVFSPTLAPHIDPTISPWGDCQRNGLRQKLS